jgi:hypothetical protein
MNSTTFFLLAALALPFASPNAPQISSAQGAGREAQADPLEKLQAEYAVFAESMPKQDGEPAANRLKVFQERARALMSTDPRGELAVRTRVWLVVGSIDPAQTTELREELLTKDLDSPALVGLVDSLRPNSIPDARAKLAMLAEKAGDRSVRGRSLRMLADQARAEMDGVRAVETEQIAKAALVQSLGEARAAEVLKLGAKALEAQYVALLERIAKDYADVRDARKRPLGPRAEGAVFELQKLQIGMVAPGIEAEDIDGTAFKLSDYRGKVVVLDFWGHW